MARLPPNFHSYQHGSVAPPKPAFMAPAMALLPLLRWPLGYTTLSPVRALSRGLILLLLPPVWWFLWRLLTGAPPPANEGRDCIIAYVAIVFVVTLSRFARRLGGQYAGEEIHQTEAGYSILAHVLPLPAPLTEQLIVPGLLGWAGWKVAHGFSFDLGCWLMVCAASYFIVANFEQRSRMAQRRAPIDDKIQAGVFAATLDRHEQRAAKYARNAGGKAAPHAPGPQPDVVEVGRGARRRRW